MPQTKIQGKFYPLKSEEWLDSINQLTHSELKILYYVRSLDPYSNGINLTPAQIARDLSTKKNKMHRSTVGRALKSLDKKGFINMELIQVRIKVNPKGCLTEPEPELIGAKNDVATTQPCCDHATNVATTQPCCDHATNVVTTQHRVQPRNIECSHTTQSVTTQQLEAETQLQQGFESSKIFKTYSDFKKTLSEGERENFFNFVKEQTKNLERKINDLEAWLASLNAARQNRWEIYYRNYQEEKLEERSRTTKQDSSSAGLTPAQKKRAIAEFQKRMKINQPVDEPESENTNDQEYRQKLAEVNKLLDNPPEKEKSQAQQRREQIAQVKRKQQELDLERKRVNAERQRQQELDEPDPKKRKEKMIRESYEFLRNRQQQNPEIGEEKQFDE